ncbi:MAG: hypothetical protein KF716_25745 [Anaerolineae bacterium]|nr:hypothetical protein [Anaerolineae bacterium]
MVKVLTSRHSYSGKDRVDATVKSSEGPGDCLTPTWRLVAGHKLYTAQQAGNQAEIDRWRVSKLTAEPTTSLTNEQYTAEYIGLLRQRYAENKQPFLDLVQRDQVTLTCYCAAGQFCHRHIAVDVLEKIANHHQLPFERGGEIDPKTSRQLLDPSDPRYQTIDFGVVPIREQEGETTLGYAAMARVANARKLNAAMELGHFHTEKAADAYLSELQHAVQKADLPLSGARQDIRETEAYLAQQAWETNLPGHWGMQTVSDTKAWETGSYVLHKTPDQLQLDRDYHEIRFGIVPILTPNGWHIADAAAALISQGDKHSIVELAHFGLNYRERADLYLNEVEDDINHRGIQLAGKSSQMSRALFALETSAQENGLTGDWTALTPQQVADLGDRQLHLTHDRADVRTMSTNLQFHDIALD